MSAMGRKLTLGALKSARGSPLLCQAQLGEPTNAVLAGNERNLISNGKGDAVHIMEELKRASFAHVCSQSPIAESATISMVVGSTSSIFHPWTLLRTCPSCYVPRLWCTVFDHRTASHIEGLPA